MKFKVIEVSLLNDLLANYNSMKREGESFEEFILCTTEDEKPIFFEVEE